jgi:hypothetical protein
VPGHFRFKGTAIGAGGYVSVPFNEVIEVQAASALPEVGGHGSARSVDFRYREMVRFDLAYSEVVGSTCNSDENDGKPVFSTRVRAAVEGLNIMDVITADRIVANLVSTFEGEGPGEPSVRLLGSRFENLRIAGIPVKVIPAVDVLDKYDTYTSIREAYGHAEGVRDLFGDAALRERFHEAPPKVAQWFSHPVAAQSELPAINGISTVSLVRKLEPESGGLDCWGHVIHVAGFGTVRLGEVSISPLSRSVTMLLVDSHCPVIARVEFAKAEDGCGPGRP